VGLIRHFSGRCNALASSHGPRIQISRSSSVITMTGMAFGWIGSTTAFGDGEEAADVLGAGNRLRYCAPVVLELGYRPLVRERPSLISNHTMSILFVSHLALLPTIKRWPRSIVSFPCKAQASRQDVKGWLLFLIGRD
jgi:hypothetical protein